MQVSNLTVKCRKNCSEDANGVRLSFGESIMDLQSIFPETVMQHTFGFLKFRVSPLATMVNKKTEVEIRWQDVVVKKISLYAKAPVEFRIPIRSFKTPSSLRIKLASELGLDHFEGDFGDHSTDFATMDGLEFVADDDILQGRKHLLLPAQTCARGLGLSGNYMTEERTAAFEDRINSAITEQTPLSVIRLGDGEGRVLGYPDFFSDLEVLTEVLYYHFGPESMNRLKEAEPANWVRSAMEALRALLAKSLSQADVVGLPISEYFDRYETAPSTGLVGFACSLSHGVALAQHLRQADIVGANVFQVMAGRGRVFKSAAMRAKAVHVVGPWDISEELGRALGMSIEWIKVPGHYTWRGEKGLGHYPELFKYVERKLVSMENLGGQLFFVGAGILGKYYCTLIKERGGVALDIGSVLDSLVKRGRPDAVNNDTISFEKL